jgi:hypothetical protein
MSSEYGEMAVKKEKNEKEVKEDKENEATDNRKWVRRRKIRSEIRSRNRRSRPGRSWR